MKRFYGAVLAALLVVTGILLPGTASAQSGVNSFRITTYDIQYELLRDSEGHSVLKTKETITADFPLSDQNHGIERAIPTSYDGHSTQVSINSVTDPEGHAWNYTTRDEGDAMIVRIGDAATYAHGLTTYVIEYTQRDVTRFFQNTNRDEWYWDTNGTEWQVPIDELSITARIDDALNTAREGEPYCYTGAQNATNSCAITEEEPGVYKAWANDLSAGENVTFSLGFKGQTFTAYQASLFERLLGYWLLLQILMVPFGVILIITMGVLFYRRMYRTKEQDPIVAEYIPPKDASVVVSAQTVAVSGQTFTAQLIDLAVRRYIAIIETAPASTWKTAEYTIEIKSDLSTLREEEREILTDMFNGSVEVGAQLPLKTLRNNMSYHSRTLDNDGKLKKLLEGIYGIRAKDPKVSKFFYRWAIMCLVLGVLTLSFVMGIAAFIIWMYGLMIRPLTDKGLMLRRYVLGLDRYIKASEAERLKFLQAPDTAQKIGYTLNTNEPGELVKLYERTLPYAILFGREQQWAKQLGEFYSRANTSPDWYGGSAAFNGAIFAASLHSFSTAAVSYGGISSSSSSGGSSGGGFSGGGGGGGGGGGW